MPKAGIHGSALDELERRGRRRAGSKPAHSASVAAKVTQRDASARLRISPSFEPSRLPMSSSSSAPTTGSQMAIEQERQSGQARYLQR